MPGRNDPCPCGSGKKYKRCCYDADQRNKAPVQTAPAPNASTADAVPILRTPGAAGPPVSWEFVDDGLDDLSNSVLDLIKERRFDDALAACKRLLEEFPDVHDGFERSALVHRAMGNHALAADFFRKTYDFANDPVRRRWYDQEVLDQYREDMEREERLAAIR